MTDTFSSLEHFIWFVTILNSLKTNISARLKWFFAINQFQSKQKLHLWKGSEKKISLIFYQAIGLMSRAFTDGPGDRGSIPGRIIPKTQKMVLDPAWLSTQHYKVTIMGKVEQSWEWSNALPQHLGVVAIEKEAFGSPLTKVADFTFIEWHVIYMCISVNVQVVYLITGFISLCWCWKYIFPTVSKQKSWEFLVEVIVFSPP